MLKGYSSLRTPRSLYNNQVPLTITESECVQQIEKYCQLYESTIKEIYEQKIEAYKVFYSFCLYNVVKKSEDKVSIDSSDFFLIQSFIISNFKQYITSELSELDEAIVFTFNYDESELISQESLLSKIPKQVKSNTEAYIKSNLSQLTDNFNLKKHLSKLEESLNKGETELSIFKLKFLNQDSLRKNFPMPKLKLNYQSFAIKSLKVLASFNLVSFISSIIIEEIYNSMEDEIWSDFKKMDSFIKQISKRDSYFQNIKDNFDNEVDSLILKLKNDLNSSYSKTKSINNTVELKLFCYQIKKMYESLNQFVVKIDLKTKDNGTNIDNLYKSEVLKRAIRNEIDFLMSKWSIFNLGNDSNEPKKTSIFGPPENKWYKALEYLDRYNRITEEKEIGTAYRSVKTNVTVGIKNDKWIFLDQLVHEGLKFGISYSSLIKEKKKHEKYIKGELKKSRDKNEKHWTSPWEGTADDRERSFINTKSEGRLWSFDKNELFNGDQTIFYFGECGGSIKKIKSKNISAVWIKILDINNDVSNNTNTLDSVEFKVFFFPEGSKVRESEIATEWISNL